MRILLASALAMALSSPGCSKDAGGVASAPSAPAGAPKDAAHADAAAAASAAKSPRVLLPSGKAISLELARSDEEKGQGLMYRESMPADQGMVFLFDKPEPRAFWMKNCHFPLDMIFTLKDGTVVGIQAKAQPCRAEPCATYPSHAPADTVVELNGGLAAANGIEVGARLRFLDVPER